MSLLDNPANVITVQGYPCMDEGVREHFGREHSSCEWTLVCRWTDRAALMIKLLGGAAFSGGVVSFNVPSAHPLYPWLVAAECEIEGVPGRTGLTVGAGGMIAYDYARLRITFKPMNISGGIELGEERIDYSGRIITAPPGYFHYGTGTNKTNLPSAEAPPIIINRATLQRTLLRQLSIPVSTIFSLMGHVNNAPFLGGAAQSVLFTGCCSSRTFDLTGNRLWDITYNLIWDGGPDGLGGWNRFLLASPSGTSTAWVSIFDPLNNPPYPTGDLTQLGFNA